MLRAFAVVAPVSRMDDMGPLLQRHLNWSVMTHGARNRHSTHFTRTAEIIDAVRLRIEERVRRLNAYDLRLYAFVRYL